MSESESRQLRAWALEQVKRGLKLIRELKEVAEEQGHEEAARKLSELIKKTEELLPLYEEWAEGEVSS